MKKTLSIVLTLCMVLGLCAFSVAAAPEGTAITDAAGFLAMDPAGTYYLANDITLAEPYAQAFTGTLDGNGKTVTVSAPMFVDFGGTVKNLVIEGSITSLAADAEIASLAADGARGAVAARVNCGTAVVFENIVNKASVSATGSLDSDDCAGGIVGKIESADATVNFINCENNGAITGLNQLGGIAGYVKAASLVSFTNCVNNGEVKEAVANAYSGGIICRADVNVAFDGCVNNANVSSGKDQAGGIFSYVTGAAVTANNCVNNGDIFATDGKSAGIAGNINPGDVENTKNLVVSITNCVNNGKIANSDPNAEADKYAGGIAAQIQKTVIATVANCVNNGEVNGLHDTAGIVGHTTQAAVKIIACQNNAKVYGANYGAGILGYGQGTKSKTYAASAGGYANEVLYCINAGEITAEKRAGGIVASTGADGAYGLSVIDSCINTGNVLSNAAHTNTAGNCAGGIVGYAYGSGDNEYAYITNCINTGNITSKGTENGNASYFLGYTNSKNAKVTGNVGMGTLECAFATYAVAWNNANVFAEISGNKVPADNAYALVYENGAASEATAETLDPATLTSGAAVYAINQAAGSEVIFMTVDGTFAPTVIAAEDGSNSVILNADGTYGNPKAEPEVTEPAPDTTEPAPDTTEPDSSTETGDSFVIFAVIAAISVLGVAVVAKRREN